MNRYVITGVAVLALTVLAALLRENVAPPVHNRPAADVAKGASPAVRHDGRLSAGPRRGQREWQIALMALAQGDSEADENDPYAREARLQEMFDAVPLSDVAHLLNELARGELTAERFEFSRQLVRRWGEHDPDAAATWAAGLPDGDFAQSMVSQAAIAWANADLTAASGWARTLPDGSSRTTALSGIGFEAVRTAPIEALRIASEMTPGRDRNHLALQGAREWAASEPQAAMDWVGSMMDSPLREQLLATIAADYAERDPVDAAQLALEALPPGRAQNNAIVGIVQRWVQTDPEPAAAWVSQIPESALRRDAAQNLVAIWGRQDLAAVGHWLNEQPAGPARDTAVSTYVSQLDRSDSSSEEVLPWLETIADAGLRQQTRARLDR